MAENVPKRSAKVAPSPSRAQPRGMVIGKRLRVAIAAPAHLNPYPILFHRAVQRADPAMACDLWRGGLSWRRLLSARRPHILHLHWLELLYRHYAPWQMRLSLWLNLLLAIGAARLLGTRIVYTVHNVWQHEREGQGFYRLANRFVLRLADAVHVHSDAARAELTHSFACRCPVVVIPHGSYVAWYPNDCSTKAARERLGLSPDAFVYLSLGQVRPYKGVEELLQAFAEQTGEDLIMIIAGRVQQPEYGERLRMLAAADPRVRLHLDYVPDDQMQHFMNAANVAVLPYRRTTTSGAAILALSFGLPVIAPALGPFPALLEQGAGILYNPQRPHALTEALQAAPQADLVALRSAAWATAQRLDWAPIGRQLAALYRQIIRGDRGSPVRGLDA